MVRQRLVIATLLFLGAFAVIAQLAWNTAESTGGPWFSTSISRDLYSTTLISATILVAILAALAAGLSGLVGRETRALDLRLNILRSSGVVTAVAGGIDIDRDIEAALSLRSRPWCCLSATDGGSAWAELWRAIGLRGCRMEGRRQWRRRLSKPSLRNDSTAFRRLPAERDVLPVDELLPLWKAP